MPRVEMEVGPVLNRVDECKYDVWGADKSIFTLPVRPRAR